MRQLHAIIHGRVQGVSFRANAQWYANRLGLVGWVRNLPDETVETIAVGEQAVLEEFLTWLHKGPTGAWISLVEADWSEVMTQYINFEIRYG